MQQGDIGRGMNVEQTPVDLIPAPIDEVGVEERVQRFTQRSIKKASKVFALKLALRMIDLTTLEGRDTPQRVQQLCYKARNISHLDPELPAVAAVCVYPTLIRTAKMALGGSTVKVAAVATAFPSGMSERTLKVEEARWAVAEGADEIDMVISRGHFLAGEYNYVFDEIASVKAVCGDAHLKVILETGELGSLDNVRLAADIAIAAGADFIKTSTGKVQPAATMPVTLVMLDAIKAHYYKTGELIGMKPAGGIATAKQAMQYLVMLRETLGQAWLTPNLFRFGASRLANDILMQLMKERTGNYQSIEYFSRE
jgi:deoxyribose-phosphate aldolase